MPGASATDTIFALSSGRLPAGVAVVRISGPNAIAAIQALSGEAPEPRRLKLLPLRSRAGDLLDRALVVLFPGPRSFTGDDCAELHLHGGRAVVAAVSRELASLPGLRPAEAGEFSLKAFRNGKFDLPAAEALADLIDAETEAQRKFAIENASGRNGILYQEWRKTLLFCRAMIEAELDFPEEDDVPGAVSAEAWSVVDALRAEIEHHLRQFHRSEIIRDGFRVAIVGAPNAGKSSLLNALVQRDVAIVSDEPGTTRDLIEVALDLEGLKVLLTDTAGIRDKPGKIEAEGINRARAAARRADLVLLVIDGEKPMEMPDLSTDATILHVRSKADLAPGSDSRETSPDLAVSALTGQGMVELLDELGRRASAAAGRMSDVLPFRERHVSDLTAAVRSLERFAGMRGAPLELAAEELRLASDNLSRVIGTIEVDDLLDVVFSRFCIGK